VLSLDATLALTMMWQAHDGFLLCKVYRKKCKLNLCDVHVICWCKAEDARRRGLGFGWNVFALAIVT
jgi:hypothetical protein